jgi:hypothetical protein
MTNVRWIIPAAKEVHAGAPAGAPRAAATQQGLRIGLLDNTKDNAGLLLQLIGERVARELGAQLVPMRKDNAATGAGKEILDQLAREADCVLTAMAD